MSEDVSEAAKGADALLKVDETGENDSGLTAEEIAAIDAAVAAGDIVITEEDAD